tara:strand:+ start:6309 stop:6728 length:420 start_codon:yes stop_codon:yes gene_type:complete
MINKIKKKVIKNQLTDKEIKERLKEYIYVEDISKVNIGTHLRYFTIDKNGNKLFRLGGFLNKINMNDKYVVLGNNKLTWSVQMKTSKFYKKMSYRELKKKIERKLTIKFLKKIQELQKENDNLKNSLKELKKKKKKKKY